MTTPRVIRDDEDVMTVVTQSRDRYLLVGVAAASGMLIAIRVADMGWTIANGLGFVAAVLIALAAITFAHVTTFDRNANTYRSGWMTMGWWRSRSGPLASLHAVMLVTRDEYGLVMLLGVPGGRVTHVWVTGTLVPAEAARGLGEEVALFTGLDLVEGGQEDAVVEDTEEES